MTSGFCCTFEAAFAIARITPSGKSTKIALVILFAGECERNLMMCLTFVLIPYKLCLILICLSDWKNILFGDDDRKLLYTAFLSQYTVGSSRRNIFVRNRNIGSHCGLLSMTRYPKGLTVASAYASISQSEFFKRISRAIIRN